MTDDLKLPYGTLGHMVLNPLDYPEDLLVEALAQVIRGEYGEDARAGLLQIAMAFKAHEALGITAVEMARIRE